MMNRKASFLLRMGPSVALAIGMIAFSQGLSFARWNEFAEAAYQHNHHAWLITLLGVGLFVVGLVQIRLVAQLRETTRDGGDSG